MAIWQRRDWADDGTLVVEAPDDHDVEFKDGCFRLSLGGEAYSSGPSLESLRHDFDAKPVLTLEPGQFAYLITLERLHVPREAVGLINMKTDLKLEGLVNVSGFHADPGYCGKLIFGVFNAGPRPICLRRRDRIFRLWLMDYAGPEDATITKGYEEIPRELIQNLVGSYPSAFVLQRQLSTHEVRLAKLEGGQWRSRITVGILIVLLVPFIASLYAAVFGSFFDTIGPSISAGLERLRRLVGP